MSMFPRPTFLFKEVCFDWEFRQMSKPCLCWDCRPVWHFNSIWSSIGISQEITSFIHFNCFFFPDFSTKIVSLKLTLNLTWGGNTYCSKFIPNKCIAFLIRPPLSFLITSLVKIWKSISQSCFDKKLHTSTKSPTSQNFQNVILVPSSLLLWKVCIL